MAIDSDRGHATFSASSVTQSEPGRPCWADIVTSKLGTTKVEAVRDEGGFCGQLAIWNFGCLRIAHVKLSGAAVRGMRRQTSPGRHAFSWLAVSRRGTFELCYDGRSTLMEAGQMAVLDARRTYVTTFALACEVLWVRVPNTLLAPQPGAAAQVLIDGSLGAGRVVFDALNSALGQALCLSVDETRAIGAGLGNMIAAVGAGAPDDGPQRISALQRVKDHILDNLHDDLLSATSIASANGLSARYVNKLFESEGSSLMRWVWRQRLEAARTTLASADQESQTIGNVAYAYGFKSASHFSHAFHHHFGYSPSSVHRLSRAKRSEGSTASD